MAAQKNAIGVVIEITVKEAGSAIDISGATKKDLILKKPSGTVETKTGAFTTDGTDGKYKYTTVSGDLDQVGEYSVQGDLVIAGFTGRSAVRLFEVEDNL